MNNKLIKQNAIMILYITNFIDSLDKEIKQLRREYKCKDKYLDIKTYCQLKEYFEQCLKEVNK